jgi:hypothetical protein
MPVARAAAGFPSALARDRVAFFALARFGVRADFPLVEDFARAFVCRFIFLAIVVKTPLSIIAYRGG